MRLPEIDAASSGLTQLTGLPLEETWRDLLLVEANGGRLKRSVSHSHCDCQSYFHRRQDLPYQHVSIILYLSVRSCSPTPFLRIMSTLSPTSTSG